MAEWKLLQADLNTLPKKGVKWPNQTIANLLKGYLESQKPHQTKANFDEALNSKINEARQVNAQVGQRSCDAAFTKLSGIVNTRVSATPSPGPSTGTTPSSQDTSAAGTAATGKLVLNQADLTKLREQGKITEPAERFLSLALGPHSSEADLRNELDKALTDTGAVDKDQQINDTVNYVKAKGTQGTGVATGVSSTTPAGTGMAPAGTGTTPAVGTTPAASTTPAAGTTPAVGTTPGGFGTTPGVGTTPGGFGTTPGVGTTPGGYDPTGGGTAAPGRGTTSKNTATMMSANVNVGYSRKWGFDMSASSKVIAKIVAVPPPQAFLEALEEARQGLNKQSSSE